MGVKSKRKGCKKWIILGVFVILMISIFVGLLLTKEIRIAPFLAKSYSVCGVDVSHYQGTIDWPKLAGNAIDFAYIKSTEGSSHVDEKFRENWKKASNEDLLIGAYHFFSFESEGKRQADWFIQNVGSLSGKLPPVVDIEYYSTEKKMPPVSKIRENLSQILASLKKQYSVKPIIYTTYPVYHKYIEGYFSSYPLWIRNVYYQPNWDIGAVWKIWQYTDRAVLNGYAGQEKYIDKNVFCGKKEELMAMRCP